MKTIYQSMSILLCILLLLILCDTACCCKDIITCGSATAGDYSLMLKVRDPSRPGLQVLSRVPEGYMYTYHHPWFGTSIEYTVDHTFIGVTTEGDTHPNIIKPGMAFSTQGIAFGDADTMSNWVNPTRNAWDDFDWIRYACQQADTTQEAVDLLTTHVVDRLHAPGVSENLFVVGPTSAAVIEADAFHHDIQWCDDVVVMSNYPKELWSTQWHKKRPIAPAFDTTKTIEIRKGRTGHLGSLYGIRVLEIHPEYIKVRQIPQLFIRNKWIHYVGEPVQIMRGERKTVGDYSITVHEIHENTVKLTLTTNDYAWEQEVLSHIHQKIGDITVQDMMNWSRLHETDLDGLRPMCEDRFPYEACMIYQIPKNNYNLLSLGWFSPNHACSSIYVPVHIGSLEINHLYENGEAAQQCLDLLRSYGHSTLTTSFENNEEVFLQEITTFHNTLQLYLDETPEDIPSLLTIVDTNMQQQAWLTQQLWTTLEEYPHQQHRPTIQSHIESIWNSTYINSLEHMYHTQDSLETYPDTDELIMIVQELIESIVKTSYQTAQVLQDESIVHADLSFSMKQSLKREGVKYAQDIIYLSPFFTHDDEFSDVKDASCLQKLMETPYTSVGAILCLFFLVSVSKSLTSKRKLHHKQ